MLAEHRPQIRIDASKTDDGAAAAAVEPPLPALPPVPMRLAAADDADTPMSTTLLLSLFLLILAFFIALVSMARPSDDKSIWVLRSVAETFAPTAPDGDTTRQPATVTGDALSVPSFAERLHRVFATELAVAVVRSRQGGRRLSVSVPASAVFEPGRAALLPTARTLLDDVVIVVGDRPAGVAVAIDARLTLEAPGGGTSTLARRRAAALAAAFTGRGIAADTLSVGIAVGPADGVRLAFVIDPEPNRRTNAPMETGG